MSVNLYSFTNPRPRRRTTHNGLSTRDSIVNNRISAKRGKNVAALIFETLRNHARPSDSLRSRRLQSPQSLTSVPQPRSNFCAGICKGRRLGLGRSGSTGRVAPRRRTRQQMASRARGMPKSVHSPDNDSKERADDTKALTISEGNC